MCRPGFIKEGSYDTGTGLRNVAMNARYRLQTKAIISPKKYTEHENDARIGRHIKLKSSLQNINSHMLGFLFLEGCLENKENVWFLLHFL